MTGPADDAELVVKMLNSGAPGVMLDLEDSNANTWQHLTTGIHNVLEAVAEVDDRGHPPCQHRAGGRQLAELQACHADQLERAGFDLRQANRPGQLHASVEPFQGEAQVALEHRRRSREEQGGGKTRVVARGRLELQGTLDIRPGPGGIANDLHGTCPVHQGGGLTDLVMPGPGAFDAFIQQHVTFFEVALLHRPFRQLHG